MTHNNKLGEVSKRRLAECHPILQEIIRGAVEVMDLTVICGYRGESKQMEAFNSGASKAKFGESLHNVRPSRAVDVAPWPINWSDRESFVLLAGVILAETYRHGHEGKIIWGGDWDGDLRTSDEGFRDYGHFEIKE